MCSFRIICQNNGTCYLNSSTNVYSCICANNFYGPNCQYGYKPLNSTTFINSTILTQEQGISLLNLIGIPSNSAATKVYQASLNGFYASNFHSKVDGINGTLTVIKSGNGNIFGGFTMLNWGSPSGYYYDKSAYIFSLTNMKNYSCIINQTVTGRNSLYISNIVGPTFGDGYEINTIDISGLTNKSSSVFRSVYQPPLNFTFNSQESNSFLAGSINFQTIEIEVYTSIDLILKSFF